MDRAFSLEEVNEALDKVKQGKSKGKTILKIAEAEDFSEKVKGFLG